MRCITLGMAARAWRSVAVSAATLAALTASLGATACAEDPVADTGVSLTIQYGDETPAWLYVAGATEDGRFYGPSLLPDPPRPLAAHRETVLLSLPETMDGEVLSLSITGLNAQHVTRMRGSVRTEIVRHRVQPAFVSLAMLRACPAPLQHVDGACVAQDALDAATDDPPIDIDSAVIWDAAVSPAPDAGPPVIVSPDATVEPRPDPMSCEPAQAMCSPTCQDSTHCELTCADSHDCTPRCIDASCAIDCQSAEHCQPSCEGRAACEIACGDGGKCETAQCKGEAQCLLRCAGGEKCELHCQQGKPTKCSEGLLACNRPCPDGAEPGEDD